MTILRLTAIGLTFALMACQMPASAPSPSAAQAASAKVHQVPTTRPVVEMWNGGIYLVGIKPFILFAAWEDGTVLRRGEPGPLQIAQAPPGEIVRLLNELQQAGFFNPPMQGSVLYADGPEYIIIMRDRGQTGELHYHGEDPDLNRFGPNASPSRAQMEAFYKLWVNSVAAIKAVPTTNPAAYQGAEPTLAR